jgi:RNA polymerase sigma factor (sigma-70 family)
VPYKDKIESEANATTVTDEGLILRVSHGDATAFETLVDLYQKPALRVAQRCIGQQAEAEDLVQEAFLQVHRRAHQYNPETASFKTWFFSILTNVCRNAIKRNRSLSFAELREDAIATDDLEGELAHEEQRAAMTLADAAPLLVIPRLLTNEMIRSLYASATHYISMSHGEGWDLSMMEAAVSGLGLIAPRHTAYLTYLRDEDTYFVPAPIRPATIEGRLGIEDRVLFDGLQWWEPDEDAAAEIIRRIVRGQAEPKESPRARIIAEYTWEKAATRLLEAIF